jgi:Ca2+-binding EF-hand superfamily protein
LKEGSSTIGLDQVREIVLAVGVEAKEEEVVALFKASDADGSGGIDEAEFVELVKKLQAKAGGRSLFEGATVFPARSADGPSFFDKVSTMFASVLEPVSPAIALKSSNLLDDSLVSSWKAMFNSHLKEGSSTIGLSDVYEIVKADGIEVTEDEISAHFKECVSNGSSTIDVTDFEVLMKTIKATEGKKKAQAPRKFLSFFKF